MTIVKRKEMPQCLSPPDFKSKSPAIVELLPSSTGTSVAAASIGHQYHHLEHKFKFNDHHGDEQHYRNTIDDVSSYHHHDESQLYNSLTEFDICPSGLKVDLSSLSNYHHHHYSHKFDIDSPSTNSLLYHKHYYNSSSTGSTVNSSSINGKRSNSNELSGAETLTESYPPTLDDFVYLEFFVDTIKPEYASLNSSSPSFIDSVSSTCSSTTSSIADQSNSHYLDDNCRSINGIWKISIITKQKKSLISFPLMQKIEFYFHCH